MRQHLVAIGGILAGAVIARAIIWLARRADGGGPLPRRVCPTHGEYWSDAGSCPGCERIEMCGRRAW